jgi:1-phosphatidylinositol-4-phosphate 5-kinase
MFNVDNAEYLSSLTGRYVLSELGSPGKSGSFFYFSQDYRFIIKTIHRSEHNFILQNLQHYSEHVKKNPHTLISRIFGLHRVKQSGTKKIHFVVMGNVFPSNKDIHEVYDLKGSRTGRVADEEDAKKNPRTVLKDQNWINRGKKMILQGDCCDLLALQIERDVSFLMLHNIMDYSLLLGIHDEEKGNSDKIRDTTLSLYVPDPDSLSRRATAATKSSKAAILKKSNQETPVGNSAISSTLPDVIPSE